MMIYERGCAQPGLRVARECRMTVCASMLERKEEREEEERKREEKKREETRGLTVSISSLPRSRFLTTLDTEPFGDSWARACRWS